MESTGYNTRTAAAPALHQPACSPALHSPAAASTNRGKASPFPVHQHPAEADEASHSGNTDKAMRAVAAATAAGPSDHGANCHETSQHPALNKNTHKAVILGQLLCTSDGHLSLQPGSAHRMPPLANRVVFTSDGPMLMQPLAPTMPEGGAAGATHQAHQSALPKVKDIKGKRSREEVDVQQFGHTGPPCKASSHGLPDRSHSQLPQPAPRHHHSLPTPIASKWVKGAFGSAAPTLPTAPSAATDQQLEPHGASRTELDVDTALAGFDAMWGINLVNLGQLGPSAGMAQAPLPESSQVGRGHDNGKAPDHIPTTITSAAPITAAQGHQQYSQLHHHHHHHRRPYHHPQYHPQYHPHYQQHYSHYHYNGRSLPMHPDVPQGPVVWAHGHQHWQGVQLHQPQPQHTQPINDYAAATAQKWLDEQQQQWEEQQ